MTTQEHHYVPDLPTSPGETLLETLDIVQMSQAELAERMGRPRKTINEIIRGKTAITPETAIQLEMVLGIPASFWNKREIEYQEALATLQHQALLEQWVKWSEQVPYKELVKRQWITKHSSPTEVVRAILSFFGVVSPDQWQAIWGNKLSVAFRRSTAYSADDLAVAAWLRRAELVARDVNCHEYDETKFRQVLQTVKTLTTQPPKSETYQQYLVDVCREAGVAVVIVPSISKSRIFGASQWLSPRKAMIAISNYYKTDDIFWYTFFHEAAHILSHSKKEVYINLDTNGYDGSDIEIEANQFAREFLIPETELSKFVRTSPRSGTGKPFFDKPQICRFAEYLGIAPSIVVGRLQHDGLMEHRFRNELKTSLDIVEDNVTITKIAESCET